MRMRLAATGLSSLVLTLAACGTGGSALGVSAPVPDPQPDSQLPPGKHTRYSLNNSCYVLKSKGTGKYVAASGSGYAASATAIADAQPFFFKPAELGSYLLYDTTAQVLNAAAPATRVTLDSATDTAIWSVKALGDTTAYPLTPVYDREPTPEQIAAYRGFADPFVVAPDFIFANGANTLHTDGTGALTIAAPSKGGTPSETFSMEKVTGCKTFPEAEDNTVGDTFKGKTADGGVLGMADVHVHTSSTTFLGHALWGAPYSKFGVTRALGSCAAQHGQNGERDVIGGFLAGGGNPAHATDGWPTFSAWPAREALTHQAIYWKWLERGWKAGLRIMVNDVVENGTLCELQKNNSNDPTLDCNEMKSAGRQVGTMYGMQDYIDAQYGGPGAGWFRIVQTPDEARAVIAKGKLALVLGIEISNFLNCQVTYQPGRLKEPYQEDGSGGTENSYACKMTETGAPDEILTQMNRIYGWGVRQVISIHEFDNAFGGNGVFFPIINIGNRENSGGLPSGTSSEAFNTSQTPTGEYWTTYDCPLANQASFSGYLWDSSGGASGKTLRSGTNTPCNPGNPSQCVPPPPGPPACQPAGQGGRYGGSTLCYPDTQQCNARWMTPIGVYMYSKLMEKGFIFDFDHMELHMKSQALDLTEAQPIPYPIVSTHGTFGGTSLKQTQRVLRNGGFIYPSLGDSSSFISDMNAVLKQYDIAAPGMATDDKLFGFGFGTDTNGLSGQAGPENIKVPGNDTGYPYTLFTGGVFQQLPEFVAMNSPVQFKISQSHDAGGALAREWDIATEGSAHYGLLSDFVESINVRNTPEAVTAMRALFNSAERYLRTWERTLDAQAAIAANGGHAAVPPSVLVAAPKPGEAYPAGD